MRQRNYPGAGGHDVQPADSATTSTSALQAVQVALDRRDNGGNSRTGDDEQGR
ncbi:MAG TPA: hypothetical protein VFQ44_20935 [Streptosporangiaceae bacterium]|nr:hypothetical protein [Streptosporangiaceae bacterium]